MGTSLGAPAFLAYVRGATAHESEVMIASTGNYFDPLKFGPPHFYIYEGSVYRYNCGESSWVSNNVERWAPLCVNDY